MYPTSRRGIKAAYKSLTDIKYACVVVLMFLLANLYIERKNHWTHDRQEVG